MDICHFYTFNGFNLKCTQTRTHAHTHSWTRRKWFCDSMNPSANKRVNCTVRAPYAMRQEIHLLQMGYGLRVYCVENENANNCASRASIVSETLNLVQSDLLAGLMTYAGSMDFCLGWMVNNLSIVCRVCNR